MRMDESVIAVNELRYTYPGRDRPAIDGMTFEVARGEVFGFLGPSGAGKTTTQRAVIGLIEGWTGSIDVLGRPLAGWGRELYDRIGVAFELPVGYPRLTGREDLAHFAHLHRRPSDHGAWAGRGDPHLFQPLHYGVAKGSGRPVALRVRHVEPRAGRRRERGSGLMGLPGRIPRLARGGVMIGAILVLAGYATVYGGAHRVANRSYEAPLVEMPVVATPELIFEGERLADPGLHRLPRDRDGGSGLLRSAVGGADRRARPYPDSGGVDRRRARARHPPRCPVRRPRRLGYALRYVLSPVR
jgi:hypothetical protein